MTVKELLKLFLSVVQFEQFETNLISQKGKFIAESFLSDKATHSVDFYILTGFEWAKTKEGNGYWHRIFSFLNNLTYEKSYNVKR